MILTDKELKERIIAEPSAIKEGYDWWKKKQMGQDKE